MDRLKVIQEYKMTIAIAGSGPVSKTIIETLLETPKYNNQIVLLTRVGAASYYCEFPLTASETTIHSTI